MVVNICDPSTKDAESVVLQIQAQLGLHSKFGASCVYEARPYLK
jgi:hypothetical protein